MLTSGVVLVISAVSLRSARLVRFLTCCRRSVGWGSMESSAGEPPHLPFRCRTLSVGEEGAAEDRGEVDLEGASVV